MPPNRPISGAQAHPHSETDIRVNYNEPLKIIAASNNTSTLRQAQFYTSNGGATWGQANLPLAPGDSLQVDPAVDWTSDGTAWAMTIGIDALMKMRIRCYKSVNGGANWSFDSTPSGAQDNCDREMMWADRSPNSPYKGQIYVTWHSGTPAFVARRTAGPSAAWQPPVQVSGAETTGLAIGGDITTNGAGDVFVFWPDNGDDAGGGSHAIRVAKSTNGGQAFGAPVKVGRILATNRHISVPANSARKARVYVCAGAFRTATRDLVYAIWTDLSGSQGCMSGLGPDADAASTCKSRIWFSRSTNGGVTWSAPVKINDQNVKNDQFHARLSVDETNGQLVVIYYDTVGDTTRQSTNVWMQTSSDDGLTWSSPLRVTSKRTNEESGGADPNQYGDYIGLSGHGGQFHASWTDRRNGGREEIWGAPLSLVPTTGINLFVKEPHNAWTLVHPYGAEAPEPASGSVMHHDTTLETTGNGNVYAAATGKLTIRLPGSLTGSHFSELPDFPLAPVPGTAVSLYLEPIQKNLSPQLRTAARFFRNVRGFTYINVDLSSLLASLAKIATDSSITITKGPLRTPPQIAAELLYGIRSIYVPAGHLLGQASTQGATAGSRRIGFSVLSDRGPIDPSYVYDKLRDFVSDGQPAVDSYLNLSPSQWPVLSPTASEAVLLDLASRNLYSMAALDDVRPEENPAISPSLWRRIGNKQKEQWLKRLRQRVGHPSPPTDTSPRFEFNDLDALNIFQLEALVEFYANFADPWRIGATPGDPLQAGYETVDFLDPAGAHATAAGSEVVLHGTGTADESNASITARLQGIRKYVNKLEGGKIYYDLLILHDDAKFYGVYEPPHTHRILDITPATRTVTLESVPSLPLGTSRWTIRRRPVLAIVDDFGGRPPLRYGSAAAVDVSVPDGRQLNLDGSPPLTRVNRKYDTIYLPGDTARPSKTYRIESVVGASAVRLDGAPILTGGNPIGVSRWHIPAGVSGKVSEERSLGRSPAPAGMFIGFDHYDGALFVVYGGLVRSAPFPWTSYTSWESLLGHSDHPGASIKGNAQYTLNSFKSGKVFLNYTLRVTDLDSPYVSSEPTGDADRVSSSRYFFTNPPTDNTDGQTKLRLHAGQENGIGTGSAGCLVSVQYGRMRSLLIGVYKLENPWDPRFNNLFDVTSTAEGKLYYGKLGTEWNDAIVGQLWLIRPNEPYVPPQP